MRRSSLFFTVALLALVPSLAHSADAASKPAAATTTASPVAATTTANPAAATLSAAPTAPKKLFSDEQREEIEFIIKDYLVNTNPQVIMDAVQNLQRQQTADAQNKSKETLSTQKDVIYNDPNSPVGGNAKGDVVVVEFFDYQCGYCKMVEPSIERLLKEDKNVKFVYKDYPILGPDSITAAKAALASVRQGKYEKFHNALMTAKFTHGSASETEDLIFKTAKSSGLDVEKLKKDMSDDAINKIVEANVKLGVDVGAHGTPTFIINDVIYPGAMQYDELKKEVMSARGQPPKK